MAEKKLEERIKICKFSENNYGILVDDIVVEHGFMEHEALACWKQIITMNQIDFWEIFKGSK